MSGELAPYGVCPICRGDLTRGAHGGQFCKPPGRVWMCRLCYQFNAVGEAACMNCGTSR